MSRTATKKTKATPQQRAWAEKKEHVVVLRLRGVSRACVFPCCPPCCLPQGHPAKAKEQCSENTAREGPLWHRSLLLRFVLFVGCEDVTRTSPGRSALGGAQYAGQRGPRARWWGSKANHQSRRFAVLSCVSGGIRCEVEVWGGSDGGRCIHRKRRSGRQNAPSSRARVRDGIRAMGERRTGCRGAPDCIFLCPH